MLSIVLQEHSVSDIGNLCVADTGKLHNKRTKEILGATLFVTDHSTPVNNRPVCRRVAVKVDFLITIDKGLQIRIWIRIREYHYAW